MWCVGVLNEQYRERMYDLLRLYARPFKPTEPVVCLDEKSTQLLACSRVSLPMKPGAALRQDYEYVRRGTCNLFVAIEPKAGQRTVAARSTLWRSLKILSSRSMDLHVASILCWTT